MKKTVLISFPIEELETVIIDCINICLKNQIQPISDCEIPQDKLLTIKEASEFLNLSISTLYSYVSKREIPHFKHLKRLYFSRLELIEYLKKGKRLSHNEISSKAKDFTNNSKNL